jgi:hypothetical protein
VRTDTLSLEGIERLATLSTLPEVSHRWRGVAAGTGIAIAARQFCQAQEDAGMLQAAPAVQQQKSGHDAVPRRPRVNRQDEKAGYTEKSEDGGDHQAAGASQDEPEQGAQNLAAVQRVDRQDVEDQQTDVDICDRRSW